MAIIFIPDKHEYKSIEEEPIEWISVTTLVGHFKQPFDADAISKRSATSKKSKWFGMTPEEIKQVWANEANRATTLGTWYHNQREADICELDTMTKEGVEVPVFRPTEIDGIKYAPAQKLMQGVYPEHMVFLKSAGICGQSDYVDVVNDYVNILDYKTNKEIKTESFKNWEGVSQKMKGPLAHLDDCNFMHYALQLSTYMYMILKHNHKLKPGKMVLHHIKFEEAGRDKFDNPIAALDSYGNPIVKEVIPYEVPYLKDEVIGMIKYLHDFREKIVKKKK
jgi:hypothetical protein